MTHTHSTIKIALFLLTLFLIHNTTLSATDFNLADYINTRYQAGEKTITLPDGYLLVKGNITLDASFHDLTIQGGRNTVIAVNNLHANLFFLNGCQRLTFRNFAIDYAPLAFTQATITAIDRTANIISYRVHDGYPELIREYLVNHTWFFDPDTRLLKWDKAYTTVSKNAALSPTEGQLTCGQIQPNLQVGDFVVLNFRDECVIKIRGLSDSLVFDSLTFYSGPGGIFSRRTLGQHIIRNCKFIRGPLPTGATEPRLYSLSADAINYADCRQGPIIENCEVEFIGDDSVNLHGTPMAVVRAEEGSFLAALGYRPIEFLELLQAGDQVRLLTKNNFAVIDTVKLIKIEVVDNIEIDRELIAPSQNAPDYTVFRLTIDRNTIPEPGTLIEFPALACPGFTIRNNYFHDHRGRAIRVMASDGIIEDNLIERIEQSAITLGPEYSYWKEGGWVERVRVSNNIIRDSCISGLSWSSYRYTPGAISVFVRNQEIDTSADAEIMSVYPGNRQLEIVGNIIDTCPLAGIYISAADEVLIKDNIITNVNTEPAPDVGKMFGLIYNPAPISIANATNVTVENNKFAAKETTIIYVDNIRGSDAYPGTITQPVATIEKGLALLPQSGRLEIAHNNGKPYTRPYPGVEGKNFTIRTGGTLDKPLVINGNGAILSGLSVVPQEFWQPVADISKLASNTESQNKNNSSATDKIVARAAGKIYAVPFWPMSNMYKNYRQQDYWLPESRVFFIDGENPVNCLTSLDMLKTPNSVWWSRADKKLYFHLPAGKEADQVILEIPANAGFYIVADHVRIENITFILSWNDGFDSSGSARNGYYRNCVALDNCGQGFSNHEASTMTYENCVAMRCASSGIYDVHRTNANYLNCVIADNVFEAGVAGANYSAHTYIDCLIVGNKPFEQVWQAGYSRLFFQNCVIIGADQKALLLTRHGTLALQQCTLLNATSLFRQSGIDDTSILNIENCIVAGMSQCIAELPNADNRLIFAGNLYLDQRGFKAVGVELPVGLLPDIDINSEWRNLNLSGRLNSEIPDIIKLKDRQSQQRRVGAKLPESVWANYDKYINSKSSPTGVTFVK